MKNFLLVLGAFLVLCWFASPSEARGFRRANVQVNVGGFNSVAFVNGCNSGLGYASIGYAFNGVRFIQPSAYFNTFGFAPAAASYPAEEVEVIPARGFVAFGGSNLRIHAVPGANGNSVHVSVKQGLFGTRVVIH